MYVVGLFVIIYVGGIQLGLLVLMIILSCVVACFPCMIAFFNDEDDYEGLCG